CAQIGRGCDILGQKVVDLLERQVTLLTPQIHQSLQIFTFVLLFHAFTYRAGPATGAGLTASIGPMSLRGRGWDCHIKTDDAEKESARPRIFQATLPRISSQLAVAPWGAPVVPPGLAAPGVSYP